MRVFTFFAIVLLGSFSWSCSNIEDASLSTRTSFTHIFEGPLNYVNTDVIEVADGYVLLGNMAVSVDSIVTVVIKTDKSGNLQGKHKFFKGGTGKSIKSFSNDTFSGYLIIGDRIKIDPFASEVGNIEIASTRLLAISDDFYNRDSTSMRHSATIKDVSANSVKTDFRGSSITLTDDAEPRVVILSSYQATDNDGVVLPEKPLITVLFNNFSMDPLNPYKIINPTHIDWADPYSAIDKDFINAKSVHYFNDRIIWASSILKEQGNFSDSYISIPYLQEPLSYINFDQMGNNLPTQKQFTVNDISPAHSVSVGFGITGTFAETDGSDKNMFFARVEYDGTISDDTLFIDAFLGATESTNSEMDDTGEAICSTFDGGYVIAGTFETEAVRGETIGKGLRDIFLVKINLAGEISWTRHIGGSGDEVVSRIRETKDHGLIISGTNNIGGYSTMFMIKTDKNGELKK